MLTEKNKIRKNIYWNDIKIIYFGQMAKILKCILHKYLDLIVVHTITFIYVNYNFVH